MNIKMHLINEFYADPRDPHTHGNGCGIVVRRQFKIHLNILSIIVAVVC